MIRLRNALQDELPALSGLCLRSKAVWGYDETFMTACRAELTLHPDELQTSSLQVAERDAMAVGLVQVKVAGVDADLLKLFVDPAWLGSGIGSRLLHWATTTARDLGAVRMTIEADPGAVPFYERMGAHRVDFVPSQSIPGRMLPRLLMELGRPQGPRSCDGNGVAAG